MHSALSPPEAERLLGLLQAYDRDEFWLRTRQVYRLIGLPDEIWFDVVDADGTDLPDRFGRVRRHIVQAHSPWLRVVSGQFVRLFRDGDGVRVQVLPEGSDDAPRGYSTKPTKSLGI